MPVTYDTRAPKRPVNLSLNEDLVRAAREVTDNLSATVEHLLAAHLDAAWARRVEADGQLDRAIEAWSAFAEAHGSLSDEFSTL